MSGEDGVPLRQRAAGAAVAACVSAVVVNPLDVVKTRIQAQGAFAGSMTKPPPGSFSAAPALVGADHVCPPRCPTTGNLSKLCAPECNVYTSTLDVLRKIWRQEGPMALFRGTSTALAIAVPTVGIYLPCYDLCLGELRRAMAGSEWGRDYLAPIAAGATSRTLAVLCVAPLDLVRTRTQAMKTIGARGSGQGGSVGGDGVNKGGHAARAVPGLWQGLAASAAGDARGGDAGSSNGSNGGTIWNRSARGAGAVRRLWTGVAPTLARDVPYSAAYWLAVETLRDDLTRRVRAARGDAGSTGGDTAATSMESSMDSSSSASPLSLGDSLRVNFVAGVCAGAATAALTTPLDVVKTRVQIRDVPKDFAGGIPVDGPGGSGARPAVITPRRGVFAELAVIAKEGGAKALFAGWAPRAIRAGPTCGIVLVAYEFAKTWEM